MKVKSLSFASSSSHMTPQQQADFYLDVIYSRMVDLIEITKEYQMDELIAQKMANTNLEDKSTMSGGPSTLAPGSTAQTAGGGGAEGFAR